MRLLLDTHILIWLVLNDRRLSEPQRAALGDPDNDLVVSAVVAYELAHLQALRRIPITEPIDRLQALAGFEIADLPGNSWTTVRTLPDIHRDPIDRMLVAHALSAAMTVVTADAKIRRYPVACI